MNRNIVAQVKPSSPDLDFLLGASVAGSLTREKMSGAESLGPEVPAALAAAGSPASGVFRAPAEDTRAAAAHPSTNRGAQVAEVCLDWLQGTFPVTVGVEEAIGFLSEGFQHNGVAFDAAWVPMPHGMMGYKAGLACGDMKVYHEGSADMGVHFVFSGKAVRVFLSSKGIESEQALRAWLETAVQRGIKFVRSDWAFDDRADEPVLDLGVIRQAFHDGLVVSRFRGMEERRKYGRAKKKRGPKPMKEEPGILSDVVYFGALVSDTCVCFYDKAKEMLLPGGEHWVRCEFRAKRGPSHEVVREFIRGGVQAVVEALLAYLDFRKSKRGGQNIARGDRLGWWEKFMGECKGVPLKIEKVERTVARVREWILKTVAPMFAVVVATGGGAGFVRHLMVEGANRWGDVHRKLIADAGGSVAWES